MGKVLSSATMYFHMCISVSPLFLPCMNKRIISRSEDAYKGACMRYLLFLTDNLTKEPLLNFYTFQNK